MSWQVDVTDPAVSDMRHIVKYTRDNFGTRQAAIYRATLLATIARLRNGPHVLGSASREDLRPALRTLHIARRGQHGRHVIVYRATRPQIIEVLRILHDAMDFTRHLPP